jgi:hypothetical protein
MKIILLAALLVFLIYAFANRHNVIREHLTDKAKVTLKSLDERLSAEEEKFNKLNQEFQDMKTQMQGQVAEASAAKASLAAIH